MLRFSLNALTRFLFCFAVVCIFCSTESISQQKKIACKMTCATTERKEFDIGYPEGHSFSITETEGINTSTGLNPFLEGAKVINFSFADLVMGNGDYQGYIKLEKKDDMVLCKWDGSIKTIIGPEKIPVTTFEGTFFYIYGSGSFKNIQGKGTFKGEFISRTIYIVDWEGEYSIK